MKGHPFRRGFVAVLAYVAVALALALFQFARNTGFTVNVGSIAVSGKYSGSATESHARGERPLSGPVGVFYGGMEFRLSETDGLGLFSGGAVKPVKPISLSTDPEGVRIKLSDGAEIRFTTRFAGGGEMLSAAATLPRGAAELRLPYRPLRSSRITDLGKGKSAVVSGGQSYAFATATVDAAKRVVLLRADAPAFSYGKIIEKQGFAPEDYVVPQAADIAAYDRAVQKWIDAAFSAWEKAMGAAPDEDSIVSYVAESARRGNYRLAVATAPKTFTDGEARGYKSAPYFGSLGLGLRTLVAAERETLGRLSRLANERNPDLFAEPDLISYLTIRASRTLADDVAAFAKSLDPAATTPTRAVGFLSCWAEWKRLRPDQPNPFDALQDQARFVLSSRLRRAGDGVFLVDGDRTDVSLSLRAGYALAAAGPRDSAWADLGRSLVVSALSLADASGSLPADARVTDGGIDAAAPQSRIPASRLYRLFGPERVLPRAISLSTDALPGLWAWTSAPTRLTAAGEYIEVSVDFTVGETHYVVLRGVYPFKKIQLYDIDYRTDPSFERYDSSGWAYSASEQALLVKMKHKAPTERIRIFY
jgi:hypothetical protein